MSASRNELIWAWDLAGSEKPLPVPLNGTGLIGSASFSRERALVATTDYATTVRVWDTATGLALSALPRQVSAMLNLRLSDDGTRLLTVSADVSVWDLPTVTKDDAPVLLRWGEAVAGLHVVEPAGVRPIDNPDALIKAIRNEANSASEPRAVWRMVRWFFADPAKRNISPLSEVAR
jgi:WD40 repeat protein